jgi:serine/threonine protein kinase
MRALTCSKLPAGTYSGYNRQPIHYMPPEDVCALEEGQLCLPADMMADIWSLGVIAFELFTHEYCFPAGCPKAIVEAQLLGRQALPWEADAGPSRRQCEVKIDMLQKWRSSILQCLERKPERRPQVEWLVATWEALTHPNVKVASSEAALKELSPMLTENVKTLPGL